jgi:hypothetical protein
MNNVKKYNNCIKLNVDLGHYSVTAFASFGLRRRRRNVGPFSLEGSSAYVAFALVWRLYVQVLER